MKSFKSFLFSEARRNPELNPKIQPLEILKKYKDDPDVYISYRSIEKMGINPRSEFNTPNGIYCYPLKEIYERLEWGGIKNVPYAGEEHYIYVIKLKSQYKNSFINDMYTEYNSKIYDEDIQKLKNYYKGKKDISEIIETGANESTHHNAVSSMWNITRLLSEYNANKWNFILRKILGYCGMADKSSRGIIHSSEALQAVFLDPIAFQVLEKLENTTHAESIKDFIYYKPEKAIPAIKNWIKNNPDNKNILDGSLYYAINSHNSDIVQMLLQAGANPDVPYNIEQKYYPIMRAVMLDLDYIAKILLQYNANPDIRDKDNATALHKASRYNYIDLVKTLLFYNADPNAQDITKKTPLMVAVESGNIDVVDVLLKNKADPNIPDTVGDYPIHKSISFDSISLVRLLLDSKANPNVIDNDGISPLSNAIFHQFNSIIQILLRYGANPYLKDNKGQTVLSRTKTYITNEAKNTIKQFSKYKVTDENF